MKVERKSSFYPKTSLKGKANYKEYHVILRDGSVLKRVFLDIPQPEVREELITYHYLKNYIRLFCTDTVGLNIMSRDKPWDFKVELSTGEILNIEITSIADDPTIFQRLKREERLKLSTNSELISIRELEKLYSFFQGVNLDAVMNQYKGVPKDSMINNPFKSKQFIFISEIKPKIIPLNTLIQKSIDRKNVKKHFDKEKTVIVIDNRTMLYEISDLRVSMIELREYLEACPFKEIWFYTGYYSSLDTNDAEYSLAPLKVTEHQKIILEQKVYENPLDKNGIVNW